MEHRAGRRRNRRGEGAYLKQEIILGAYNLVKQRGWHTVSLRKIASEVGIAPQSIYLHFRSLDEIMHAVAIEGYKAIMISMRRPPVVENDLRESIVGIATGYLEFTRSNFNVYLLMMSSAGRGEHSKETLRQLLAMISDAASAHLPDASVLSQASTTNIIYTFWLGLHGVASADPPENMRGVPGMTAAKAVEYMVDALIAALNTLVKAPELDSH